MGYTATTKNNDDDDDEEEEEKKRRSRGERGKVVELVDRPRTPREQRREEGGGREMKRTRVRDI